MRRKLIVLILAAFFLRIVVSFLAEHGDVVNYYWWSKDLLLHGLNGFYDRNIANAMRPTYPPVTSYLFLMAGYLHEAVRNILWFLNVHVSIFPSNLIVWIESDHGWYVFNKLPAIFSDLGIIALLYFFVRDLRDKKSGFIAASLFSFVPVFWYNSSLWGQTDSVFALPMLGAFYALYKGKIKLSVLLYGLAILTKPTCFFALPIFAFWLIKKSSLRELLSSIVVFALEVLLLYLPFHPQNLLSWVFTFYKHSLGGELNYMVANAFNFWALVFGFDNRPDTSSFLGMPANLVGNIIFLLFVGASGYIFWKYKKISIEMVLFLAALVSFCAFLFLPRMHDRYFYPVLVLLIPLTVTGKKMMYIFWTLATLHLINLYHFWWVPKIPFLVILFSNFVVEKSLIVVNIFVFLFMICIFRKEYVKNLK